LLRRELVHYDAIHPVASSDGELRSPLHLPPYMPVRRKGETMREYRKRLYDEARKYERATRRKPHFGPVPPPRRPGRPVGSEGPLHHASLIYLLSGEKRVSVAARYKVSEATITKRAQKVARIVGLDYPELPIALPVRTPCGALPS
jgi:hypothetical protein